MEGMTEERFIARRVLKLVYIGIVTLLGGILFGVVHGMALGDTLVILFADMLFAVSFAFYLESGRLHRGRRPDSSEDYQRLCVYYTAGIVVMIIASFCPAYTAPVFAVAFLLAAGLNREQAFAVALFFDIHLALNGSVSNYVMTCYLILMLFGIMLTGMYEQKQYRIYAEMTAVALNVAVPVLFYYLDQGVPTLRLFLSVLPGSVLTVAGMHFLYDGLHFRLEHFGEISLDTIVDPNFHLVREIKRYSQGDYNHAIRVSRIAAHCATKIKVNAKLAAVSGFYYRLGKFGGEPFVQSGVMIAQDNCFPNAVIQILSEFGGQENPISTIESAVVHITDTLVTKFELLDHTTLSSSWNRDMVIYQTLNDESSSGIYDHSGLTMNQFLKIREFLAKEEELL
ncbi:hypothetical protein C823_001814 [Eubacterium plexicaudatum ASF492]|uniref:HD/PDEase domain-containing protein n=1 Tax=Eubacterium plexicaudatum ASF492 TaxID=1235802 RepID=N2B5W6_9FIRM|nr:hypothetical protein C823_001814 [Eubacterium plexicaudatum ASF492]